MSKRHLLEAEIATCERELGFLGAAVREDGVKKKRDLIISTGDISDIDGFFALAKYAQTGADVIFVMNYPAYLDHTDKFKEMDPGLGYRYNTTTFLESSHKNIEAGIDIIVEDAGKKLANCQYQFYLSALSNCGWPNVPDPDAVKLLMTNVGYLMAKSVWDSVETSGKGTLYFCVGGINTHNPFHNDAIKNEMHLYSESLYPEVLALPIHRTTEGLVFDTKGEYVDGIKTLYENADRVFIDFNGSMAFFNDKWMNILLETPGKICGVFVMGGVYSDEVSRTMPSRVNVINRFSCATMNQLYHPMKTSWFFSCMRFLGASIYIIANNEVDRIENADKNIKVAAESNWVRLFMESNGIFSDILYNLACIYYSTNAPPKAFDYYTALALVGAMSAGVTKYPARTMFISPTYGTAVISDNFSWGYACEEYYNNNDTGDDVPRKQSFRDEHELVKKIKCIWFRVEIVKFNVTNYVISISPTIPTVSPPGK